MRCLIVLLCASIAVPVTAQVQSRPTDPPIVSAENDAWYRLGEPVLFAGEQYFPAGPTVFFNGNTMVRTGHYNGVPLYADTTIEPYSIVYVPIGRGLLQPYERLRRGELAGTSGSRTGSFPGVSPSGWSVFNAPGAPTAPPVSIGAINAYTPEVGAVGTTGRVATRQESPAAVGTAGAPVSRQRPQVPEITLNRAENNDGIWVMYEGRKYLSAGPVVQLTGSEFVLSGDYRGFPVYTRRDGPPDVIYLPMTPNQVAPYQLKK